MQISSPEITVIKKYTDYLARILAVEIGIMTATLGIGQPSNA